MEGQWAFFSKTLEIFSLSSSLKSHALKAKDHEHIFGEITCYLKKKEGPNFEFCS